jgi:hypothetical protein
MRPSLSMRTSIPTRAPIVFTDLSSPCVRPSPLTASIVLTPVKEEAPAVMPVRLLGERSSVTR